MTGLKQLWTTIARFADVLEGVDDLKGEYILSLGKRVDVLERNVKHLEGRLHARSSAT